MYRPLKTVISIHISINSPGHDTDRTGRLHKRWIISVVSMTENDLIPLTSNQTCRDKATFSVCNVQCKDNVSRHSFRFQKTPVPLTSMTSKSPFPIHANPIASPRSEKKKCHTNFPQMLHCGSVQTKFLTYFKGACSLLGCLLLSLYHFSSFFHGLNPERWN